MTLKMYCQANNSQAGSSPGEPQRMLRFQIVPGTPGKGGQPATKAPSADKFKDGEGGCVLELINVTPEIAAQYEAGKCYDVTIAPTV